MARRLYPLARPRTWVLMAVLAVPVMGMVWWSIDGEQVLKVPADYPSIVSALAAAPDGAVIELAPGVYRESPVVERPVTILGPSEGRAEIRGDPSGPSIVVQGTSHVVLRRLAVSNGKVGVLVRDSDDVLIADSVIVGNVLRGVRILYASAHVIDNVVRDTSSPYGIGIHVANAMSWPRSLISGNVVERSGAAGVVANMARVLVRDNQVSGTSLRAIAVTEMSEGLVQGNRVTGVAGVGLYCGDMSHCEFVGNTVQGVAPVASAGRGHGGYGAVVLYHATARLRGNTFEGVAAPEPVGVYLGSAVTDRFPLVHWPPGWRGALPGLLVSAASLAGLVAVRHGVRPLTRILRRRSSGPGSAARSLTQGATTVLLAGFVVQTFHMLEHGVQVFQVYVAQAEARSGVLGARVDTEWVHFTYNAAVLGFLLWATWLFRGPGLGVRDRTLPYLLAATLIQTYHLAEHTAKIVQHIQTGVDPAPGLFGARVGLVWFHFGINLAVYAGLLLAVAPLVGRVLRGRLRWPVPQAVPDG